MFELFLFWAMCGLGGVLLGILPALLYRAGYLEFLRAGVDHAKDWLAKSEVDNALRRMWPLWLVFIGCFAVVLMLNPMKAGLALYGIGKIALAGPVGYLISYCCTARKHRPENLEDGIALGTALKVRTWIICAAIIGMAIGVP